MIPDAFSVAAIALGCALPVVLVGLVALWLLRRRSITANIFVVVLVAVLSVVCGVVGTASAMFLSGHDLGVVLMVVAVAGLVGLGIGADPGSPPRPGKRVGARSPDA